MKHLRKMQANQLIVGDELRLILHCRVTDIQEQDDGYRRALTLTILHGAGDGQDSSFTPPFLKVVPSFDRKFSVHETFRRSEHDRASRTAEGR